MLQLIIGIFLAEVRVPFNTVLLGLDALMAEVTDRPELLGDVRLMKQAAEMMLRVLNDSLDIEKMRAGQYTLELKEGSLLNVLHGVLRSMEPWARQDRVGLFLQIRPGIPHNVLCDANRLTQALLNLVSNAVKFVPHDGSGWVKVRAFRIARPSARRGALTGGVRGSGSRSTLGGSVESGERFSSLEGSATAEQEDENSVDGSPVSQGFSFEAEPRPPFAWQRPLTWPLTLLWLVETGLGRASDAMHVCMCTVLVSAWDGMLRLLGRGWRGARRGLGSCAVGNPHDSDSHESQVNSARVAPAIGEVVVPASATASAAVSTRREDNQTGSSSPTGAVATDSVAIVVGPAASSIAATSTTPVPSATRSTGGRWWPWRRRSGISEGCTEAGNAGSGAGLPAAAAAPALAGDAAGGVGIPAEQPLGRTRSGAVALRRHLGLPAVLRMRAPKGSRSTGSDGTVHSPAPVTGSDPLSCPPQLSLGDTAAPNTRRAARRSSERPSAAGSKPSTSGVTLQAGPGPRSEASAPTGVDRSNAARAAAAKLERVWIRFEVQDNGVGIKPEDQVKLFTAFHQIQAGALQKGGGSGLGLSICKEIVRRHGGAVGVQSVPGQGSTFFFEVRAWFLLRDN